MIAMLYSMVAVITLCGYVPQIVNLWKSHSDCRDISLSTWSIWLGTSFVSLLYSYYEIADFRLCLTAGVNMACIAAIITLIVWKRFYCTKTTVQIRTETL